MSPLEPLATLYEATPRATIALPPPLAALYGPLSLQVPSDRPLVLGNFVTTLDGVVALNAPGAEGGGAISGFNAHDHLVMGVLRALADAVIVGAGTLRSVPTHLWTAEHIAPAFAESYQALRASLGKPEAPLNVIVTARGELDLALPVFQSGKVPALIVTTAAGAARLRQGPVPPLVEVAVGADASLGARAILQAVHVARPSRVILVEGGPRLMGDFFLEHTLDELFLTLAPQVAGRDGDGERPGLVAGQRFAPEHPVWGTLIGIKRGGSHLFLRYAFAISA